MNPAALFAAFVVLLFAIMGWLGLSWRKGDEQ